MNLGIIAVMVSTLFTWTANMFMKKVSKEFEDNNLALVLQYIAMTIVALILWAAWAMYNGTAYIPTLTAQWRLMVVGVGIIGYIGIMFLFKAFDHLSGAVSLIIANLATFLMYFINLALYPWQESFGIAKLLIAIIFFLIIVQFLLEKKKKTLKSKHLFNWHALYPLGTAICRSLFFVWNSYFIKSNMMNPIQVGMLTETMILIIAVLWFAILQRENAWKKFQGACMGNNRWVFFLIWIFNVLAVYLAYYGYQDNPANTVNVIRLFSIPFASVMCWIFLKDKLSRRQIFLLVVAFALMIAFLFT